ncbi:MULTISPECIES: hypothetical protein [unclassified Butyrivibrio]|jgi:hypothetical protein|uniref:hypothetical protein n=1 Tax=unclassified Butyrivibrio TaxID=2639466 RepID=UPI0003B396D5|nr:MULTISPECIES: hypothetical protein [unclassified Butyrivibrio]MDC7292343.1 hypothetical protein [Butyrivibrio sp. DSM 10294]
MTKKSILGLILSGLLIMCVGCSGAPAGNGSSDDCATGQDLKPVIYLYPEEDNTAVSVRLDYNGDLTELIPEFNAENVWNCTANKNGKITFEGKDYDYLFWEGAPKWEYDFYSGFCIRGADTEAFLKEALPQLGLNESEAKEFMEFWVPQMQGNAYNMISFQGRTYNKNAKLTVTPEPDSIIRVFMAWYPTERFIKINPQYLSAPERKGFTVVEWGGNKVK